MAATTDEVHTIVGPAASLAAAPSGRPGWSHRRYVVATVLGSAALTAGAIGLSWGPATVVLGAVILFLGTVWVRTLARRDARGVVALWVLFALNRSVALLLPPGPSAWALRVDDLALGLALAVVVTTGLRRRNLRLLSPGMTTGFALFAASGVLGSLLAGVRPVTLVLGTWLALKLFVCLFITRQFTWTDRQVVLARRVFVAVLVLVLAVASLQVLQPALVSEFFGRDPRIRVGLPVITSIFPQPFQYSTFTMLALCLVLGRVPAPPGRLLAGFVVAGFAMLSLRLKALVDVVLVLVARMLTASSPLVRAWTPVGLLVMAAAGLTFGADLVEARLEVLFGDENSSPREDLFSTAAALAAAGFPLGSGFGTFGSEASRWDYSPVYAEYGLSDRYGFSEAAPGFITDASWATVLGESGWLGTLGFALALGAIGVQVLRRMQRIRTVGGEQPARASLFFLLVFLADSITSPQLFTGFSCLSLAVLLSMGARADDAADGPAIAAAQGAGEAVRAA